MPHPGSLPGSAPSLKQRLLLGLGWLTGWVVWLWARSLSLQVEDRRGACSRPGPWVYVFWHGAQFPLVALARLRPTAALVSWSTDGWLQTGVMGALGMVVVRGSTTLGGMTGLRQIVRVLRDGCDAAFAADGPRGPLWHAKGGAAAAAAAAGAALVPVGVKPSRSVVLSSTWDQFEIPLPFSSVTVVVDHPLDPDAARRDPTLVTLAIHSAEKRAACLESLRRSP